MTAHYALPDALEGATLEAVKQEVLQLRGGDLDIIGSAVSRINGLGFQLLLSTFQTWKSDGCHLRVIDPSPCLVDAFVRLSAQDVLIGANQ